MRPMKSRAPSTTHRRPRNDSRISASMSASAALLVSILALMDTAMSRELAASPLVSFDELRPDMRSSKKTPSMIITPFVFGGHTADIGRYPYLVSLRREVSDDRGNVHFCGGTLIAPDAVLTAAHCVDAVPLPLVHVGRYCSAECNGAIDHLNGQFIVARTVSSQRAEGWDSARFYAGSDVAILRLDRRITEVEPLRMMGSPVPNDLRPEEELTVVGLGKDDSGAMAGIQQEGLLPYKDNRRCQEMFDSSGIRLPSDFRIKDDMLCAGGGTTSACKGDSGGPLIRAGSSPEEDVLVGVVAFGAACSPTLAELNVPAIFTRVTDYADSLLEPFYPSLPPPPPPPSSPIPPKKTEEDTFAKGPDHWIPQPPEENGAVFVQADGWDCAVRASESHVLASLGECRKLCSETDMCIAFAYRASRQICHLKDKCNKWKLSAERTSGVKVQIGARSAEPVIVIEVDEKPAEKRIELPERIEDEERQPPPVAETEPQYEDPEYYTDDAYDLIDGIGCTGNSINKFDADTVKDCERRCDDDYGCAAFTFNWKSKRCYLKAACPSRRRGNNVSGIKQQPLLPSILDDVGCQDKTLRSIRVPSFEDCVPECKATENCAAFTFDIKKKVCYLKASCFDMKDDKSDRTGFLKILM